MYINTGKCPGYNKYIGLFGNASSIESLEVDGKIDIKSDQPYTSSQLLGVGGIVGSVGNLLTCKGFIEIYDYVDINRTSLGLVAGRAINIEKVVSSGRYSTAIEGSGSPSTIEGYIGGVVGTCTNSIIECSCDADLNIDAYNDQTYIGGIAGQCSRIIDNVIFSGVLRINQIRNTNGYGAVGGISGISSGSIINAIFAPNQFVINSTISQRLIGPIKSTLQEGSVITSYYDKAWEVHNNGLGIPVSREDLISGIQLNESFSPEIWIFKEGSLPKLKALQSKYGVYFTSMYGNVGTLYEEGASAIISIKPEKGWRLNRVIINNYDCTDLVSNNIYMIDNISKNIYVDVIYEEIKSAAPLITQLSPSSITIENKSIVIDTNNQDEVISITNLKGYNIFSNVCNGVVNIPLELGIYVVTVGKNTYKVLIH